MAIIAVKAIFDLGLLKKYIHYYYILYISEGGVPI